MVTELQHRFPVLAPLRSAKYRLLWGANICWYLSWWTDQAIFGWLALELTDSVWLVALISFYRNVPLLVFGAIGGMLGDRIGRRQVMMSAQIVGFVVSCTAAALLYTGDMAYSLAAVAALAMGVTTAVDWPSRQAALPDTIEKPDLLRAVMIDQITHPLMRAVGALVAGIIIVLVGIASAFVVVALVQLLGLAILSRIRLPSSNQSTVALGHSPSRMLAEGFRYLGKNRPLLGVIVVSFALNLLIYPFLSVLPVFARDVLSSDAGGYGLLAASNGIGAALGVALIAAVNPDRRHGLIFGVGASILGIAIMVFALSDMYILSFVFLLLGGVAGAGFSSMQTAITLEVASPEMRARATGAVILAIGAGPVGALMIGQLAERIGVQVALFSMCGLGTFIAVSIVLLMPGLRRY